MSAVDGVRRKRLLQKVLKKRKPVRKMPQKKPN